MKILPLVACMTVLVTGTAFAQEAYVYDYVPNKGVYAYDASSVGKLTAIKGSPFKVTGAMVGTNGKYFVSADSTYLYSYTVESNGAIGAKVSDIDTQRYGGAVCGTVYLTGPNFLGEVPAEFDHTGQYVHVLLNGAQGSEDNGACDGIQTYSLSSKGVFTFKGDVEVNQNETDSYNAFLPTLTGNNKFAYGINEYVASDLPCNGNSLISYGIESTGALNYLSANPITFPIGQPVDYIWEVLNARTNDTSNHIALALYATDDNDCQDYPITDTPAVLASYTADSQGNLTTTNTYAEMPQLPNGDYPYLMKLDPTGKILAVGAGTGVAFYRFNGASPITKITGVIGVSGKITQMAWDNDGHLYAQNSASGNMHVYAATTTSAKELSGSPTAIPYNADLSRIIVRTK